MEDPAPPAPQRSATNHVPAHKLVIFWHLIFKISAAVFYISLGWFSDTHFVTSFVVLMLMLAADFWVVKNVTGRLLVGLRYWNEDSEEGKSDFRFECLPEQEAARLNPTDKRCFWWGQVAFIIFWILMMLVAVITFEWSSLPIIVMALILSVFNTGSYIRCNRNANKTYLQQAQQTIVSNAFSWVSSSTRT